MKDFVEPAIQELTKSIRVFRTKGQGIHSYSPINDNISRPLDVERLAEAQQEKLSESISVTTVATFLSSVTVAMIQITTTGFDKDTTGAIGNTFLFLSVVFSMGAAFHSLLVMSWRRSAVLV